MTPTDPNPAREADGRVDREAMASAIGADVDEWVIDAISGNRDAVLRALGLHEERDASDTLHRFVSDWEDVTDEQVHQ